MPPEANEQILRAILISTILFGFGAASAAGADADRDFHALNGLMHMYAAGSTCFYRKAAFTKQEVDEMLVKIKDLSKVVAPKTVDELWSEARTIMAEGDKNATPERCALVHQQFAIAKPFIFGQAAPQEAKPSTSN